MPTSGGLRLWKRYVSSDLPSDDSLNLAADRLAEQVSAQWSRAALERGLARPAPIPVRWCWSELTHVLPIDAVGGDFAPLPRIPLATAKTIEAGGLTDLLDVFGGLASGRIMIVGAPGSGKSGAAILLLLDVLAYRSQLGADERALVPVPVLFTLRGWDPCTQDVQVWLARELTRTYNLLPAVARDLISSKRVAVFLDGLDELPQELRAPALEKLGTQATLRLLVMSRRAEMVNAVGGPLLLGVAPLELVPIPASDVADYLTRTQCHPLPSRWQPLVDYLRTHPDGAVSAALNTPLTVTLVRDTYQAGGNPAELLDASRLGEAADVENHLLDRVLPTAYTRHPGEAPPRYPLDVATRGLAYIAVRMNQDNTRDLAWWQVPRWVPAAPRIITTGLLFGLLFGLIGLVLRLVFGFARGPAVGLVAGLLAGLLEALGQAGLLEPLGPPKRLGPLRWKTVLSRYSLHAGPAIGLAFGILGWIVGGLGLGLAFGLAGGLAVGLGVGLGRPGADETTPSDPRTCWRSDRNYGLVYGTMVGLVAGIGIGVGFGFGVVLGLGVGLVLGLVGGLFYPDAWRTALACGQLGLSGHTPFRLMSFLEDARTRGVLRTVGPVYQFRHASLQDRLAELQTVVAMSDDPTVTEVSGPTTRP